MLDHSRNIEESKAQPPDLAVVPISASPDAEVDHFLNHEDVLSDAWKFYDQNPQHRPLMALILSCVESYEDISHYIDSLNRGEVEPIHLAEKFQANRITERRNRRDTDSIG
jgi:hypothetical protein